MKNNNTKSKLCKELNVPLSTFQDWINKILDDSNYRYGRGKTRYFSEDEVQKFWRIKELKEYDELCGNNKKPEYPDNKIKDIINGNDPSFNEIEFRKKYIKLLKRKRREYDMQIKVQEAALNGVTMQILRSSILGFKDWDYDQTRGYLSLIGKSFQLSHDIIDEEEKEFKKFFNNNFTDEDIDALIDSFEQLSELCEKNYSSDSIEVFEVVFNIHRSISKAFTGSVIIFSWLSMFVLSNNDFASEYSNDKMEFFRKAAKNYCDKKSLNNLDKTLNAVFKNFELLFKREYGFDSLQTQDMVKQLHNVINNIKFIPQNQKINVLKNMAKVIRLEDSNLSMYFANAIKVYCQKIEMED